MEAIKPVQPDLELGMLIDFDELFALRERLRSVADQVRARLHLAGLQEELEIELFDQEIELRGTGENPLLIRLDPTRLEITGCSPAIQIHRLAAMLLSEAGVFRIASAELAFHATFDAGAGRPLGLIEPAFGALAGPGPRLDRRFSLTWEWGTSTTGYSLTATSTEDRELYAGFKVRDSYLTLPDLEGEDWFATRQQVYETTVAGLLSQLGWRG
jgi:hypothetical protein